jgi:hypothetical protein
MQQRGGSRWRAGGRLVLVRARACEDPLETPPIRVSAGAVSRWEGLAKRLAKRSRGRAMDTRTIASVALVIAVVIVVILRSQR